ncbi:MAG: hypothetical protein HY929_08025 [Euryarchaeota archaeon]|nr:hypothetical protein [Euryarchaeota archaeon]
MKERNMILAAAILIIATFVLVDKLLTPSSTQIVLESGRAIPIEEPSYFTFNTVLLLVICAWVGGMTMVYLLLKATTEVNHQDTFSRAEDTKQEKIAKEFVLSLLDGDEKKIFQKIVESGGEVLQKDLVLETGFSKVQVTRLLDKLEEKGLIIKKRYGLTNKVVLSKNYL